MRVLEISVSAGYGGGPQHLYELVSHLQGEIITDIACPKQEPYWDRFGSVISGELFEIPERKFSIATALRLIKFVKSHKVSVLHGHGKGAGVYGRFVSAVTGIPLVYTPHGIHMDHYGSAMKILYLMYERLTGWLNDRVIFVSPSEKDQADSYKLWLGVISRDIFNGVRIQSLAEADLWRRELRSSLGVSEEEVVAVSLSRFNYQKNMIELARIAQNTKGVHFWFLGDGEDKDEIEQFCSNVKCKNVWFPGFINEPIRYLAAADIYVSTARWEGLPLAVLEAMSLAKPVVVSNVTGNRDAVDDGVTGYLYPPGEIYAAVAFLGQLSADKTKREKMGGAARHRQCASFSIEEMARKTVAVYTELIK